MYGNRRDELRAAAAIAAVALGMDFVSGRVPAAFYAQMGRASWLGVAAAGMAFGAANAGLAWLRRRSAADRLSRLLLRLPGGGIGRGALLMYYLVLAAGMYMLISEAGHIAALALPIQHAWILGSSFALLTACVIAISGDRALRAMGGVFVLMVVMFETALLLADRLPDEMQRYGYLVLRLEDNWGVALVFGLIHAALCVCLSAGVSVKMSDCRMHPGRLGAWSGILFTAALLLGNAVFLHGEGWLVALEIPFVALAGGWDAVGFYWTAALIYLGTICSQAGIIYGLIPRPQRQKMPGK